MKTEFEHYLKTKRAIQDWLLGQGDLGTVAHHLEVSGTSLQELLFTNGLSDVFGRPEASIEVQDVFNFVFLSYAKSTRKISKRLRIEL